MVTDFIKLHGNAITCSFTLLFSSPSTMALHNYIYFKHTDREVAKIARPEDPRPYPLGSSERGDQNEGDRTGEIGRRNDDSRGTHVSRGSRGPGSSGSSHSHGSRFYGSHDSHDNRGIYQLPLSSSSSSSSSSIPGKDSEETDRSTTSREPGEMAQSALPRMVNALGIPYDHNRECQHANSRAQIATTSSGERWIVRDGRRRKLKSRFAKHSAQVKAQTEA
ncbi:hypothetical protein FOA43_004460 [Brettanomyces nanus]|uniref:Uncharacterized protein n=1 Tax=Eeniella nana TaxID=13502 RepID=A0A875SBF6_EENNA|nr:uncharacterized protein FOA43_004460 [Brettanomyces nanus]QPG77062.1 hypothetical protein FOA43_004460 [Brettanomyces nanus]